MARHVSIRTLMSFFTISVVVCYALAISDEKKSPTSHVAKQVLASIGDIMSIALYLSQVPIYWTTIQKRELQGNSVLPCAMTLLNSLLWGLYATPAVQYNSLVMSVCFVGVFVEGCYLLIYFIFSSRQTKYLLSCIFAVALAVVGASLAGIFFGIHEHEKRKTYLGFVSVASGIAMYAAPCYDMFRAWKTRDATKILLPLTVVGWANSTVWFAYSMVTHDKFIMVQNLFGFLLSTLQLMVFTRIYCFHTPGKGFYFLTA